MNLSHYESMDPPMAHGYDKKRVEAGGETLPAHDQSPVLPLEPGTRPLNVVARDVLVDRAAARLFGVPDAFGHLGSDPTCAEARTAVFGILHHMACFLAAITARLCVGSWERAMRRSVPSYPRGEAGTGGGAVAGGVDAVENIGVGHDHCCRFCRCC
jgi:hypothetical protein